MGVTLDYTTLAPIAGKARDAIQSDVPQLVSNHDWWCEPIWFSESLGEAGELLGWNKIYLPGYTARDGSYIEVDFDDDQLMAYRDMCFILEKLTHWSREHSLAWEISMAGEVIGQISQGEWHKQLRDCVESMRQGFPWPTSLEEKARFISAKYASRR
jgi:hypothetical protein